jgi:hypothetical protein
MILMKSGWAFSDIFSDISESLLEERDSSELLDSLEE